jgi:ssDNA-binding Zn-finger/Zn-ribbon topoisomerase 1
LSMRIGKCPKCGGEVYIKEFNWGGWRLFHCKKCNFSLNNERLDSTNFIMCLKQKEYV